MIEFPKTMIQRANQHSRLILIVGILSLWLVILISFLTYGYENTWRLWNIPTMMPPFGDFQLIPSSAETFRMGIDPMVENPREPFGRIFNYPRIWYLLFYTNISMDDTIWIGIVLIMLFFISVMLFPGKMQFLDALFLLGFLFSPAVMLLCERGNVDLAFFVFCALAIISESYSSILSFILILFGAIWKLFPILGLSIFLKKEKEMFFRWFFTGCFLFSIYVVLSFNSFRAAWKLTQRGSDNSYGIYVFVDRFHIALENTLSKWMPTNQVAFILKAGPYLIISVLIFLVLFWTFRNRYHLETTNQRNLDSFRMGAAIYIGTFLMGNNWDYRLAFLLFVIPQLSEWMRTRHDGMRWISILSIVAIYFSGWYLMIGYAGGAMLGPLDARHKAYFVFNEVMNWMIVAGLVSLLLASSPDWIKSFAYKFMPAHPQPV
jgi:hypothetical protein